MKLTPIVELAKNCRFEIGRNGESVIAKHSNGSWVEITNKLERLRQAIIKDFVDKLEPVGYINTKFKGTFYKTKEEYINTFDSEKNIENVYDLSEWINK